LPYFDVRAASIAGFLVSIYSGLTFAQTPGSGMLQCDRSGVASVRQAAASDLGSGSYGPSIQRLDGLLGQCGNALNPVEQAEIRIELARAHMHLAQPSPCADRLQPVFEYYKENRARLSPPEMQSWTMMMIDAQTIAMMCSKFRGR
jgi:hypothetical protein